MVSYSNRLLKKLFDVVVLKRASREKGIHFTLQRFHFSDIFFAFPFVLLLSLGVPQTLITILNTAKTLSSFHVLFHFYY